MFKLETEPKFWWACDIQVPTNTGKTIATCDIQFLAGAPEAAETLADYAAGKLSEVNWITPKIAGWKRVCDEGGNELPFTPENLARFLSIDYVRNSVVHGYLKATNGMAHVRKN